MLSTVSKSLSPPTLGEKYKISSGFHAWICVPQTIIGRNVGETLEIIPWIPRMDFESKIRV